MEFSLLELWAGKGAWESGGEGTTSFLKVFISAEFESNSPSSKGTALSEKRHRLLSLLALRFPICVIMFQPLFVMLQLSHL